MDSKQTKYRIFWISLALTLITFAIYYQVCGFGFVNLDDPVYVYKNPSIQSGLTLNAIEWAFTTGHAGNWHPLTWLSLMLDWQLFGSNPVGFHFTNIVLHIANMLFLFLILKRMTNALWQSAFVAALFALHPLHVESVAWVAERKDVLSTFFWLLTMAAYLRYVKKPNAARYLLTLLVFALGLMAKPMLVTLPFVLLLLDYWPLGRIKRFTRQIIYRLVWEKIPFIVLTVISSVVTFFVQQSGKAVVPFANFLLKFRIYNVFISYIEYIEKMFWPSGLTACYPHPYEKVPVLFAVISAALLLAATILVLRLADKHRYLVTGWFWYLGTLVPVIGLVQVGSSAMADRYTYIPLTGLFIIIAWGLPELLAKWPPQKGVLWPASLIVLSVLAVCTHYQQQYWKDDISLYQRALAVTENNYMAHFGITETLSEQGRFDEVIQHDIEALRIFPDYVDALNGLGFAYYSTGKTDKAIELYNKALKLDPGFIAIYSNLGIALLAQGKIDEAISIYNKGLQIEPDSVELHFNLAVALTGTGKLEEAVKEYEKVLRIQPQNALAHNNLGSVLSHQDKFDDAIAHFRRAVEIDPENINLKNNLNRALAEKQRLQK
jgi:protein O-mannosyl-transferase